MTPFNPGDPVHVSFDGTLGHFTDLGGVIVHVGDRSCYVRAEHLSPVSTPVLFADIKVGDRIRAVKGDTVVEYTVSGSDPYRSRGLGVCCLRSAWQFFRLTPPVPPEPEYVVGAVYQDADDAIRMRTEKGWHDFEGRNAYVRPPMRRLVPEEAK